MNQTPHLLSILAVAMLGFFSSNEVFAEVHLEVLDAPKTQEPTQQDAQEVEEDTEVSDEEMEETQEAQPTQQDAQEDMTQQDAQDAQQTQDIEELEEGEIREEMVERETTGLSTYSEALLHEVVREIVREQPTMTDDAPQSTLDSIPTH